MNEILLSVIVDKAFALLAAGIEKETISDTIRTWAAQGASLEQVSANLQKMLDETIAAAQAKIDKA